MARIKSTGTRPELMLRKTLWRAGLRFRLKPRLPGKPDLVFPGARVAVFVDGCFWHGCTVTCRNRIWTTGSRNWHATWYATDLREKHTKVKK